MNTPEPLRMGLIPTMPAETYHSILAMSAGGLKRMRQSPAHFYGLQMDPNRPTGGEPTPAMKNGTLVHCALFEPAELDARYVVKPAGMDGRTKEGRAWVEANAGREVVDAAQMAAAKAQAAAVRALPDVAALLSDGIPEASAFWIDDLTAELCKCRPDWVSPAGDGVVLVDGKTCQDASPDGFGRQVANYAYDLQAAHYAEGWQQATGQRVLGFIFAAVESSWPHAAAAYMLPDDWMEAAMVERRRLIDLYAKCKRDRRWPGYAPEMQLLSRPRWHRLESEP